MQQKFPPNDIFKRPRLFRGVVTISHESYNHWRHLSASLRGPASGIDLCAKA